MFASNPPPIVETISDEADLLDLDPDKDLLDGGKTEASASEYEGDLKEMPYKMLFGYKECRVKFTQPIDKGTFVLVCGNGYGTCPRAGHNVVAEDSRGLKGFYETARTIKYLDQKLNTFQSVEERNVEILKVKEIREKGLLEAASCFKGSSTSPLEYN
jgi:hypothetical protein